MRRSLRWIVLGSSLGIGFLFIAALCLPFFTPDITRYHDRFEKKISEVLQENVHVQHIALEYQGFQPVLTFSNVDIRDPQQRQLMSIQKLRLGINVINSILFWKLEPQDIEVQGIYLKLKEDRNYILHINDIDSLNANLHCTKNEKLEQLIHWFLSPGKKKLSKINISWTDKYNHVFPAYIEDIDGDSSLFLHQYHGKIHLPGGSSSFNAKLFGLAYFQHWLNGDIEFVVEHLPIAQSIDLLQLQNNRETLGDLNLISELSWGPTKRLQFQNYVEGNNISIVTPNNKKLLVNSVRGNFLWQKQLQGWQLNFHDVQLQLNNELLALTKGAVTVQTNNNGNNTQSLQLDYLPLNKITGILINYDLVPKKFATEWLHYKPTGDIHKFTVKHYGSLNSSGAQYELTGWLHKVSFEQWQSFPGITNLSGYLHTEPHTGYLKIDSQNFGFYYPKLFRNNIFADRIKMVCSWKQTADGWDISTKHFLAQNKHVTASGKAKLIIAASRDSYISSKIQFHVDDMHHASHYLPVGIMPVPVVNWLDHAFSDGKLTNGEMILEGKTKDFPYINHNGQFLVQAQMQNVSLSYLPGWPPITNAYGYLRFEKQGLTASVSNALTLGTHIQGVTANIPDLRHAKLFVKGKAFSSGQELHLQHDNFAKLAQKIGNLSVKGGLQLGLNLVIPIDTGNASERIQFGGQLALNRASVTNSKFALPLQDITGKINFTQNSVSSTNLFAKLLNEDFNFNLVKTAYNPLQIKFNGRVSSQDLLAAFHNPVFGQLEGVTNYSGLLNLSHDKSGINSILTVNSDLNGLKVKLPKPFDKPQDLSQQSSFKIKFQPNKESVLQFNYGDRLNGVFNLAQADNKLILDKGALNIGNSVASLPLQRGLKLEGELSEFDLSQWRQFLKLVNPNKTRTDFTSAGFISSVDVRVHKLLLDHLQLDDAKIVATHDHKSLMVNVDSSILRGDIEIPNEFPKLPLRAKLSSVTLDNLNSTSTMKPSQIPNLQLNIANLKLKNRIFKNVHLSVVPQGKQLWIKQLTIKEPLFALSASGIWRELNNYGQNTSIQGSMNSSNIGAVLNQLHITDNMVQGAGNIQFNLSWQNSPMSPKVSSMSGQVGLQFRSGRIIHLTQTADMGLGLGRVLNLLSLQTLPRRLIFDFSDITSPGFPYDEMRGNFMLNNGNAQTQDAYLEGPLAKVRVNGKLGLENKDYQLRLIITPNVTSSLPLVATITAGPIAGAITWAADKILSRQVKKMTEIHYNVTGSWSKPNVVQMS